jgi:Asp-tRNA(Asn)/Glu-tRNA(Gln) amidotransferase A subunit family amidase
LKLQTFCGEVQKNPWNRNKTTGGNSGGEGGLVAAGCFPFGIGSDFTGSISTPSNFCGVYGFKPTSSRISLKNCIRLNRSIYSSVLSFSSNLGPIFKSANDLVTVTSNLFGNFKDDLYLDHTPYDLSHKLSKNKKIKIGYLIDMPLADAAPEIRNKMKF